MNRGIFVSNSMDILECDKEEAETLFKAVDEGKTGNGRSLLFLVYPRKYIELLNTFRDPSLGLKEFYSPELKKELKPAEISENADPFTKVVGKIMANEKHNLKAFFKTLIDSSSNMDQGIEIDVFSDAVDATFMKILSKEERNILKNGVDQDFNGKIDLGEIVSSVKKGLVDEKDKILLHFYFKAIVLDKENKSTIDYFDEFGVSAGKTYNKKSFQKPASNSLQMTPAEADMTFDYLSYGSPDLPGEDLIKLTNTYRTKSPKSNLPEQPKKNPESIKPTPPITSPEKQLKGTELIDEFKRVLRTKKLSFVHIYRMADDENTGWASVIRIMQTITEMVPEFGKKNTIELIKTFDTSQDGFISKDEYDVILMKTQEDLKDLEAEEEFNSLAHQSSSHHSLDESQLSALSVRSGKSMGRSQVAGFVEDGRAAAAEIAKILKENGMTFEDAFRYVDRSGGGGEIEVLSATKCMREMLDGMVTKQKIAAFLKYVDRDLNGCILKSDFITALSAKEENKPEEKKQPEKPQPKPVVPSKPVPQKPPSVRISDKKSPASSLKASSRSIVSNGPVIETPKKSSVLVVDRKFDQLSDGEVYSVIKDFKRALVEHKVNLREVFNNTQRRGTDQDSDGIPVLALLNQLSSAMKGYSKQNIMHVLRYCDTGTNGVIEREAFELIIGYNEAKDKIEESVVLEAGALDENSPAQGPIKEIKELLKVKNISLLQMYAACDADNNNKVTILDIKLFLCKLLDQANPKSAKLTSSYMRDLKAVFKTSRIDIKSFLVYHEHTKNVLTYLIYHSNIKPEHIKSMSKLRALFVNNKSAIEEVVSYHTRPAERHTNRITDRRFSLLVSSSTCSRNKALLCLRKTLRTSWLVWTFTKTSPWNFSRCTVQQTLVWRLRRRPTWPRIEKSRKTRFSW